MSRRALLPPLAALAVLAAGPASPVHAERVAYVNAVFHPMAADGAAEISGGALLVDGGRVVELALAAPAADAGWRIVDLGGAHVWPGLVDAASDLGLVEIGSVRGTVDTREVGELNSDLRVEVAFHPDSRRIPPALAGGVTTVHVVPDGDRFLGASAAMRLSGWTWEEMTLAAPVAQHLRFPRAVMDRWGWNPETDRDKFEKERKEALARLDEIVGEARGYARAREAAGRGAGPAVDLDPKLEALRPVLAGELPLWIWADERNQIGQALDWAKKEGLAQLVLVSGPDAAQFAERLAAENVAVVIRDVLRLPERPWDPYDEPFAAAGKLHAAGVRIAFADGGDSSNARNLPFHAAMSVAFGLPRDAAHRALTAGAAEILGVAGRVGRLAPGLEATFFVATGDPLDIRTSIERVVVRGVEIDLAADPQRQLWERYRARPEPAAAE